MKFCEQCYSKENSNGNLFNYSRHTLSDTFLTYPKWHIWPKMSHLGYVHCILKKTLSNTQPREIFFIRIILYQTLLFYSICIILLSFTTYATNNISMIKLDNRTWIESLIKKHSAAQIFIIEYKIFEKSKFSARHEKKY